MRLLRVQIPEFRVLKDVDITFEKDFTPAVFPIGSQNGGGKSTLLQLIFTLLHCPFHLDRENFLKNILQGLNVGQEPKLLAKLHVFDTKNEILEFFVTEENIEINPIVKEELNAVEQIYLSSKQKLEDLKITLSCLEKAKKITEDLVESLNKNNNDVSLGELSESISKLYDLISGDKALSSSHGILRILDSKGSLISKISMLKEIPQIAYEINEKISQFSIEILVVSEDLSDASNYLKEKDLNFICTFDSSEDQLGVLLCRHSNKGIDIQKTLERIARKTFLAAPSTQIFIFTSKESQKLLFKRGDRQEYYYSFVKNTELHLPGLFTYDFVSVDLLIDAFKTARDQDFKAAIQSGAYGHSYQDLINDLNLMLGNKKINVSPDLSEITFKLLSDSGEEIDLYPEDLSHGELKRLSLYMWLRSRLIEDSIVLMDEVEIAFHPDWQYQIVSDLAHWAPTNQYILATHSYELCQAVTPAHVKELEPKLLNA